MTEESKTREECLVLSAADTRPVIQINKADSYPCGIIARLNSICSDSQRLGGCSKDRKAESVFSLSETQQNNLWVPFTNSKNHSLKLL